VKSLSHAESATLATDISFVKNNPFRPGRTLGESSAFSLTEVVIAMGVAAVAFTSIIGLFPLGLNMSKESYESVQAALLAQTIMADIKDQQTGAKNLRVNPPYKFKLLQTGANSDPLSDNNNTNYKAIFIDITNSQPIYLAYNQLPRSNSDTDPAKSIMLRPCLYSSNASPTLVPDWYVKGSNAFFAVAKITFSPTCRFLNTKGAGSQPVRIDVSIEMPGNVTNVNRTAYLFTGVALP